MRVTSRRNPDSGKYEVLIVKDGPDGVTEDTKVDSTWNTSPEANDRVRQLKDEEQASKRTADYEAGDKSSSERKKQQTVGGAPRDSATPGRKEHP
jgi:hypothetical protein